MSTTKTFLRKKPDTGDSGASFFSDLENNIDINDRHFHNGLESSKLTVPAIIVTSQTIASGSWGSVVNGLFSQVVTIPVALTDAPTTNSDDPGDMTFSTLSMEFRLSDGEHIAPKVTRTSDTTYTIFSSDNTVSFIAIYTT